MASADEDDYMSDKFLEECQPHGSKIVTLRHVARKRKMESQHDTFNQKSKTLSKHAAELQARTKALATAISSDNPGFRMLAKMGYKSGTGLGKSGEGRVEPIPISIKTGRTGLGKEAAAKEKQEMQQKLFAIRNEQQEKISHLQRNDFRNRMRDKFAEKKIQIDLYKCQKVCHQLDSDNGISEPDHRYFWPQSLFQDEEDQLDEDESFALEEQLLYVTEYLRTNYFYCVWCAHTYNDAAELNAECPGNSSTFHDDD